MNTSLLHTLMSSRQAAARSAGGAGSEPRAAGDVADEKVDILIVDDLPDKLLAFQVVLEELGQNLVLVSSGADALRELLQREFAVILLDVNMPEIDGLETAELIRRHGKTAHTPIIFVTAYADEMQTARGYALGAVDYILSPVVPEILRSKVKVFVELYRAQRRAKALAKAEADRVAAEEATRRYEFLAFASRELSGSLDLVEAMHKLLEMLVPGLSDVALLSVDTESNKACTLWRSSVDPQGPSTHELASLAALPRRLVETMRSVGEEGLQREVQLYDPPSVTSGAPQSPWPREFGKALVIPLRAGETNLGVLVLTNARPAAPYLESDLALLDELTNRAAIAFENARLYRNLHREMQRAQAAEEKLQEVNRRKDEFLAMLSHELRNPLAPIRNAAEVMRRIAPADAGITWAREVVERQVAHLAQLVDDLLDVSRITQGKIVLKKEPVELGKVIDHSVETARSLFEQRRHQLSVSVPPAPIWVSGDFARLAQVVGNLLNNAAKYATDGGNVELTVTAHHGEAIITVKDNGVGIDRELLPHVFELFTQGDRSLDRSQGGLGVGLTVVQRLAQLHGGSVSAASDGLGKGAVFTVALPCISEVEPKAGEPRDLAEARVPARGHRVLVVDDNVDAAESMAMFLRLEGHEVKTVTDGPQAVACSQVFAPQVAVIDIGLPGMNGYDVAQWLREHSETASALLIAVTGYGQKEDRTRSEAAGFHHHFVKPADPRLIQAVIVGWDGDVRGESGSPANRADTG